jgi:hypothetical protein
MYMSPAYKNVHIISFVTSVMTALTECIGKTLEMNLVSCYFIDHAFLEKTSVIGTAHVLMINNKRLAGPNGRSNTGIVGSNPARGMDVFAFFCVVLSCVGSGLVTG